MSKLEEESIVKKFAILLLIVSLLLLTFGVVPVEASGQQALEFHSLGKSAAGKAAPAL